MVTRKTAMALLLMLSITAAPAVSASQAPRLAQEQLLDVIGVVAPVAVALGMAGVVGVVMGNVTSNNSSSSSHFEEAGTNEALRTEPRPLAALSAMTPEVGQSSSLETIEPVKLQPGKRKAMLD